MSAGECTGDEWHHHKQSDRKKERIPWHKHVVYTQKKFNDRNKGHQDNEVVGRDLHDRIGRVAFRQVAPDKDHRRAGRGTQKHSTGQIVFRQFLRNEVLENNVEKEPCDAKHREWFDQPVGDPRDEEAFRVFPDMLHALKVDLHHHRINHDPDQYGDRNGDLRIFQFVQELGNGRKKPTDQDARHHA